MSFDARPHRRSGVYGIFRLDGGPIDPRDAQALGIQTASAGLSYVADGVDENQPVAIHMAQDAGGSTVLAGYLDEPQELALRLHLTREASVAHIARAALKHFGAQLPVEMLGEWSLLHRDPSGQLTLALSAALRDPIFYAICGRNVAVSPDLFRLAKIGWVGSDVDESGLLFPVSRAEIRAGRGNSTMLRSAKALLPASVLTINTDGRLAAGACEVFLPQGPWRGTFEDATAEAEQLLRKIMRDRLARVVRPAPMLSGGLDSSLIAWLTAEEHGEGQSPINLTSVAPPNSGMSDESAFAKIVANHVGLPLINVAPDTYANIYRPPDRILTGANGFMASNRHCLTEAMQIAAREVGADMLINGTYGEMSVTASLPARALRYRLRALAVQARNLVFRRNEDDANLPPFHIRLAPHRMTHLPTEIAQTIANPPPSATFEKPGELLGYVWGVEKALAQGNEFYPGAVRADYPFRDVRLLRLFAGFPVDMLLQGGHYRPVVRKMLEGQLPDSIRLRKRGMPASPDHFARLQTQAETARSRITMFRAADVDEWLDLDWLDTALGRIGARGAEDYLEANQVQLTTLAAEFLTWWRTRF